MYAYFNNQHRSTRTLTAEQLQQATQGEWYNHQIPQSEIKRILTDSRHAEAGDVFLALKGERFDAHNFVAQVAT